MVVNLSSRTFITEAETSLLSKGFSFCPHTNRNRALRRIRLKEYFYKDDDVDGNFSAVPGFRKKIHLVSRKE